MRSGSARHGARRRSALRREPEPTRASRVNRSSRAGQGHRIGRALIGGVSGLTLLAAVIAAGSGLGPGLSGGRAVLDVSNAAADVHRTDHDDRGSRSAVRAPFEESGKAGSSDDQDDKVESEPEPIVVPRSGSGETRTAEGGTEPFGSGDPVRYRVEVEKDLPFEPAEVAAIVDATLRDERSWAAHGGGTFQRVDDDTATLRIVVATPETTDELCYPLDTGGKVSCRIDPGGDDLDRVVLNADRWAFAADSYGDDVDNYRKYVVNHEVGHSLGYGHASCTGAGEPAPVMVQQTKSVGDCEPNPWPLSFEFAH